MTHETFGSPSSATATLATIFVGAGNTGKGLATKLAIDINGVKSVTNRMTFNPKIQD